MANHLWVDYGDDRLEANHPGCVWSIFHSLDYHQWHHNVKKILPHKKHNGEKRAKRNKSPKTRLNAYHSAEVQKLLDGEASHFLADQSSPKTSSTHKRSLKARIKALVSEENCKEKVDKRQGSTFPPRLQRTFSIHHLEPSDDRLDKISTKWTHPIIFLAKNADPATKFQDLVTLKQKSDAYIDDNHTITQEKCEKESEICVNELKDYVGVLEIFKVNKDLFQNYIRKGDDGKGNCFNGPQESKSKARLMKSGSFPAEDLSYGRNLRPSKLKYKQNESWSFKKGDEFFSGMRAPKVVASNSAKDICTKLGPLMGNDQEDRFSLGSTQESDNQESNEGNQETRFSLGSMQELDNQESNEGIQETGFALGSMQESDNQESDEGNQETGFPLDSMQELENQETNEENQESDNVSKARLAHFRRTSSLNKSLEKYARLFDYTFSHKAKWNLSKSLKLTNEYEIPSGGNPISHTRIQSLPHLDLFEESKQYRFSGNDEEKCVRADANEDIVCVNSVVERSDISQRFECGVRFKEGLSDEVICPNVEELSEELDSQEELEKNSTEFRVSAVLEHICIDNSQLNQSDRDFLPESCIKIRPGNFENDEYVPKNQRHNIDLHTKDNADFNYVEAILELSGFTENGFDATWHSSDQPLNPSVFEELEACWPHEPETSENNNIIEFYHHEHLFDLVNEVLLQIYERLFPYYPKALSSTCRIRPAPIGARILEEVWRSIVGTPSLGPEVEPSLDSLVGQDFGKDDGWMNLQMESECVGLEIEDLIFDELLEEIMNS